MAWNQLAQLLAFLNVQDNLRDALQTVFGDFQDRLDYVAQLPEAIWRQGVTNARIIVTPGGGGGIPETTDKIMGMHPEISRRQIRQGVKSEPPAL